MFGLFQKKEKSQHVRRSVPGSARCRAALSAHRRYLHPGIGGRRLFAIDSSANELTEEQTLNESPGNVRVRVDLPLAILVFESLARVATRTASPSMDDDLKISYALKAFAEFFGLDDRLMRVLLPNLIDATSDVRDRVEATSPTAEAWKLETDSTAQAVMVGDYLADVFLAAFERGDQAPRPQEGQLAVMESFLARNESSVAAGGKRMAVFDAITGLTTFLDSLLADYTVARAVVDKEGPLEPAKRTPRALEVEFRLGVLIISATRTVVERVGGEDALAAMRDEGPSIAFKMLFDPDSETVSLVFAQCRDAAEEAIARIAEKDVAEPEDEMARDGLVAAYIWGKRLAADFLAGYDPDTGTVTPHTEAQRALVDDLMTREIVDDDAKGRLDAAWRGDGQSRIVLRLPEP
jgi:hypothetical protein